jgi:outer membrane lipoprotein-sorting protein
MRIKWLFMLLIPVVAWSQNAETVLSKVRQKYDAMNKLCVEFKQTFHWKMAGETQTSKGRLCSMNGTMFRIEQGDQTIVTDGVTLWTMSKSNQQVLIDLAGNGKDENPFLKSFIEKYTRQFKSELLADETIDDAPHFHLRLTAATEDEFEREIDLWINKSTFIMSRVKQVDVNDNDSVYEITAIHTDMPLSDKDFKLTVPEGYEAVDLR